MYDIESIRAMYTNRAVEPTQHFHNRIKERLIKHADIRSAIMNGEIIEQYLDDYPNPSVLILGYTRDNGPLHVAVGMADNKLWLITAYFPTLDIWEADFKTKKAAD